ncbi:MAG: D-alanine--D-alanine ligase family protein [Bacteroidota bacterium]
MRKKIRVGVIFGGRSGEHEVSLVSAASVMQALDRRRYEVVPIGISREGRWLSSERALELLRSGGNSRLEPERVLLPEPGRRALVNPEGRPGGGGRLDVVFPLVHGTYGEDGTLQGLLELAGIPYVGAGVLGSALGMDKIVQKELFRRAGLPCARWVWFHAQQCRRRPQQPAQEAERSLRYPMFVKPANTGSSVGISKAHDRRELERGLRAAAAFDRKVIVEQGVAEAREIEVGVLGNEHPRASVPGEIIPSNEFYDYDAKYVDGKSQAVIPASLPETAAGRVRELAVQAFRALDCAGMARVDFFVTRRRGTVYVNEVNTIPGFTSISMFPKLWEATGVPYGRLLDELIRLALRRHAERSLVRTSCTPGRDWHRR